MPYKDAANHKAAARRSYERHKLQNAQRKLIARLNAAYDENERDRANGVPPTPMVDPPVLRTLDKYNVRVFLEGETWIQTQRAVVRDAHDAYAKRRADLDRELATICSLVDTLKKENQLKEKEATIHQHLNNFQADVRDCVLDAPDVRTAIVGGALAKTIQDKYTNSNTLKQHYAAIVYLLKLKVVLPPVDSKTEEEYNNMLADAAGDVRVNQVYATLDEDLAVAYFTEYKQDVLQSVDLYSQTSVLLHVYDELTMRDDFGNIHIINERQAPIRRDNFYNLYSGELHMNDVKKTGEKYALENGTFVFKFSKKTQDLIKESVRREPRNMLVTTPPYELLRDVGLSVNKLRHAKIAEEYADPNSTAQTRAALAQLMGHSLATQKLYQRVVRSKTIHTAAQG